MGRLPKKIVEEDEEDFEDAEDEMEEEESEVKAPKPGQKDYNPNKPKQTKQDPEEPTERYQAFYQPEVVAVVDTVSKEVVVEGLPSVAIAKLEAFKLNLLDKIGTVSGI